MFRPFDFRTNLILYTLLGLVIALLIHFILLSTTNFNWLIQ